jgi:peptide subunit release factor 1 (eRF1)
MWSNNDGMDPNWKPDFTDTVRVNKSELEALREVAEAARDALDDMDRMFRTTQRLEDALKELDEARRG